MQAENNLYSFLKKNAAFTNNGQPSSRRDSDFTTNLAFQERNQPNQYASNTMPRIRLFQDNNDISRSQGQMINSNHSVYTFANKSKESQTPKRTPESMLYSRNPESMLNTGSLEKIRDNRSITSSFTNSSHASTSFESARIEAAECLDNLSREIQSEMKNIDRRIESFTNGLMKALTDHFKNVRDQMYKMVDMVIKESERAIYDFKRVQQQRIAGQLMQIKSLLQKEFLKVQVMRGEINRSNWRKTAGEIISSEIQQRVFDLLDKSEAYSLRMAPWTDKTALHMREIQNHLRQCLRLQ